MLKKSMALSKVYTLLEPGPVIMVTTALKGRLYAENSPVGMKILRAPEYRAGLLRVAAACSAASVCFLSTISRLRSSMVVSWRWACTRANTSSFWNGLVM